MMNMLLRLNYFCTCLVVMKLSRSVQLINIYFMHYFTWFIENFWDTLIEGSNSIIGEFQTI